MKKLKWIILIVILGAILPHGFAQNIVFGGSSVNITQNTELHVPGDVSFIAETEFHNDGDVFVGGDWNNLSTSQLELQGGSGTVIFNGLTSQMIGGNERSLFSHVDLQRHVILDIETQIYGSLILGPAILTLNNSNLFMMPGSEISGANDQGFIDASSDGFLIRPVANQEVLFPVGSSTDYLPATIQNQGVADNYGLRVLPDVLSGGNTGASIPEIDDCVVNTWYFIEEESGGSMLNLNLQWDESMEGPDFTRSLSAVGHHTGGAWVPTEPSNASGSGPWHQQLAGITQPGAFAVGDTESPMAVTIQYDEQEITITEGWSGISSYLDPVNPEFDAVFSEVIDEIGIVQDLFGVYWPSQGINTLGTWDSHSGYQVKMSGEVVIDFAGTPLVNTTLSLDAGWNLFPILINCKSEPSELFAGTSAVIIREVAGTGIYWPEFNINTLEFLFPGSAYMAYMESAEDIPFPGCKKAGLYDDVIEFRKKIIDPLSGNEIVKTNLQHTIAIESAVFDEAGFAQGDILMAVSDSGTCFGSVQWEGGNASLTLFGDDLTTRHVDGFLSDEQIWFKHVSSHTKQISLLTPEFDLRFGSHNGLFQSNGISAITGFKSTGISNSDYSDDITIYPNPADETVWIRGGIEHATVSILDLQGFLRVEKQVSGIENIVSVKALTPGIYIIEIVENGVVKRERLIIK